MVALRGSSSPRSPLSVVGAVLVFSAVLLAGCSDGGSKASTTELDDGTSGDVPPGADHQGAVANETLVAPAPPVTLSASDCQLHAHNFAVPADQVTGLLPEGFEVVPMLGLGGAPMANAVAVLGSCGSLSNGTADLGPFVEQRLYLGVTAPEAWQVEDVGGYRLVVAHATDNAALAAQMAAWNVTLTTDVDVELGITDSPTARASQDRGSGPFSVSAAVGSASAGPSAGGKLRFIYAQDGMVMGAVDHDLQDTVRGFSGGTQVQLSGAPFGNGASAGNAGLYDWAGTLGFTVVQATAAST